jgi:predicted molibdopterin-dependent oxidoreductase YjgC
MLAESDGDVVILPATTRYESPGGGTETSTERRVIFSPEVQGRRIGSAKPEWWVFGEAMARAFPSRANYIRFDSAAAIRSEIARAVPLYRSIETLSKQGDQFQWGGRTLFADGRFPTPDGKAHFTPVISLQRASEVSRGLTPGSDPSIPGIRFRVSTRRGKQFNSMVQREVDPLTGAAREDVLMSNEDMSALSLRPAQRVRLRASAGELVGRVKPASIKPGNLEVHWPEGNVLLSASKLDPHSKEPDYNAWVTLEPLE